MLPNSSPSDVQFSADQTIRTLRGGSRTHWYSSVKLNFDPEQIATEIILMAYDSTWLST